MTVIKVPAEHSSHTESLLSLKILRVMYDDCMTSKYGEKAFGDVRSL